MSEFRTVTCHDNLVVQLSGIIQGLKQSVQHSTDNPCAEQALERMRDVETSLCRLMADMISSPMTGRLHQPNPAAYVDAEARRASLSRQLALES
jgi:hypothetical protein